MFLSIKDFWDHLKSKNELSVVSCLAKPIFQVLGIYLYMTDKDVQEKNLGFTEFPEFLLDIVLFDGKESLKCILDPRLNEKVQFHELRMGLCMEVEDATMVNYGKDQIIILKLVKSVPEETNKFKLPESEVPSLQSSNIKQIKHIPLISSRTTYLNLWATNVPFGHIWNQAGKGAESSGRTRDYSEGLYSNKGTVLELFETYQFLPKYPSLLVRILFKGKLHHYGRSNKNNHFPFQGYFMVGDHTGICTMVVWDTVNCEVFRKLNPGELITLEKYQTAKCILSQDKLLYLETVDGLPPKHPVQIKINYSHQIKSAFEKDIKSFHGVGIILPEVKYNFVGHDVLRAANVHPYLDLLGYVMHAGHLNRERLKGNPGFVVFQWLKIVDHTGSLPVWIKLYSTDMTPVFPSDIIALTRMQVVCDHVDHNFLHLTNIAESQVYNLKNGYEKWKSIKESTTVKEFMEWYRKEKSNTLCVTVGGLDIVPWSFPSDFKTYFTKLPENEQEEAKQVGLAGWLNSLKTKWINVWENLAYRERRSVLFFGQVISVQHVFVPNIEPTCARKREPVVKLLWQNTSKHCLPENLDQIYNDCVHWVLPHLYTSSAMNSLNEIIKFPCFSTEQLNSNRYKSHCYDKELPDVGHSHNDFYSLVFISKEDGVPLVALYFPEILEHPPCNILSQMLLTQRKLEQTSNVPDMSDLMKGIAEPHELYNKEYLFVLDLVSLGNTAHVAILLHKYDKPVNLNTEEDIQ